jgi:hypothetical protein
VASSGNGTAAPFPPGGDAASIQLRVRLIDVVKVTVYDEETLTLPIGDVTQPVPVIANFVANATAVVRAQLNNKTARIPVSWLVNDRPDGSNLVFEQVLANNTTVNVELPRQNPFVASSGNGVAAPIAPGGNAASITLRLRVINLTSQATLTQKDITLPISETGPTPAITLFTTTTPSVTRAALNSRTARVPVSWVSTNRPANSNLVFEQVLDNGTVVNVELPRQNPYVSSEGNGMAAPVNPGTSTTVKLQVRLVDLGTQATLAQKDLTVGITEGGTAAKIAFFTTTTQAVDYATLANKTARIPVSWSVDNRPNGSNLVFEQVLGNNSSVNVELPRQNPFVSSSGNGMTAPVAPGGTMNVVQLRLRLINLSDGATIDSRDITIPINNVPGGQTVWEKIVDPNQCYGNGFPQSNGILVGGRVKVIPNMPNGQLVVSNASNAGQIIGNLASNESAKVTSGPDCYKVSGGGLSKPIYLRFWKVRSEAKTLEGWVTEYFMDSATGQTTQYILAQDTTTNPPPQIVSFTADPTNPTPGSNVTLSWEVKNATRIGFAQLPASLNAALATTTKGTTTYPIPTTASGAITIELIASNGAGQETRATVTLSVVGLPQTGSCAFSTSLSTDCPLTQETVNAAMQTFEKGFMVWNGNAKKIYVMFQDGTWQMFDDTWKEGDAEPVPGGEPPPSGQYVPVRGFGKVWTQLGGQPTLGWATSQEQSYQATWETHPPAAGGGANTIHFKLPDGRVVHLGATWTTNG